MFQSIYLVVFAMQGPNQARKEFFARMVLNRNNAIRIADNAWLTKTAWSASEFANFIANSAHMGPEDSAIVTGKQIGRAHV